MLLIIYLSVFLHFLGTVLEFVKFELFFRMVLKPVRQSL